jgi:hypothetical protein
MPIMASHGRSDARGTARLLANMALESIANPTRGDPQEVALNNMFRLLQSFQKDLFFGQETPDQRTPTSADKLTLRPPSERHVREVKEALEQATAAAFGDVSKDQAMASIEKVLRSIAYPSKASATATERARATSFFKELVERL